MSSSLEGSPYAQLEVVRLTLATGGAVAPVTSSSSASTPAPNRFSYDFAADRAIAREVEGRLSELERRRADKRLK